MESPNLIDSCIKAYGLMKYNGGEWVIDLSILLIKGFLCFLLNFWRIKISSYKFWNNIPLSLIFFVQKKQKMLKQWYYLMYNRRRKKNCYSNHQFVFKCLITICICYLFELKHFNYLYKNNIKNYFFQIKKIKKNKNPLLQVKTTHFYPEISMVFILFYFIQFFKTFQNFCYPNSIQLPQIFIHPH